MAATQVYRQNGRMKPHAAGYFIASLEEVYAALILSAAREAIAP